MNINTNTPAMALLAHVASLQNGVEKNSDKACWYVWGVIKACFAFLSAHTPGCATRFDTAPSAATPEKLAVLTARFPKLIYFTHNDSKASVLNTSNRFVVCKVIAPDTEREAFVTEVVRTMTDAFGLTVEVAEDFSTVSVLTYYAPRDVAQVLQNAQAQAQAETTTEVVSVPEAATAVPEATTSVVASETPSPAKGKGRKAKGAEAAETPASADLVIA